MRYNTAQRRYTIRRRARGDTFMRCYRYVVRRLILRRDTHMSASRSSGTMTRALCVFTICSRTLTGRSVDALYHEMRAHE